MCSIWPKPKSSGMRRVSRKTITRIIRKASLSSDLYVYVDWAANDGQCHNFLQLPTIKIQCTALLQLCSTHYSALLKNWPYTTLSPIYTVSIVISCKWSQCSAALSTNDWPAIAWALTVPSNVGCCGSICLIHQLRRCTAFKRTVVTIQHCSITPNFFHIYHIIICSAW